MKYNESLRKRGTVLIVSAILVLMMPDAMGASTYKTLHKFTGGNDGSGPEAGLIFDAVGNMYGTTGGGGASGLGTVFQLTQNSDGGWKEKVLTHFKNGKDGCGPSSDLVIDQAGRLYGTGFACGASNRGAVFQLTANADGGWTQRTLHQFSGGDDGGNPSAGVILDSVGNLYGTTLYGGTYGNGVVFELSPNADGSWTESVLHQFAAVKDGANPWAGLIFDQTGSLYGTTSGGGAGGGTVFELTPHADGSWTENILHNFCATHCGDGLFPYAGLIFDQTGNLYGTTLQGGRSSSCSQGCGVVFKLTPNLNGGWTETILHAFNGKDGSDPFAGLIFDTAGNLYGTTALGGILSCGLHTGCGVAFKLAPTSDGRWKETVLHRFFDNPGHGPTGHLIFDGAENLYGTTVGLGPTTFGSIFEITP